MSGGLQTCNFQWKWQNWNSKRWKSGEPWHWNNRSEGQQACKLQWQWWNWNNTEMDQASDMNHEIEKRIWFCKATKHICWEDFKLNSTERNNLKDTHPQQATELHEHPGFLCWSSKKRPDDQGTQEYNVKTRLKNFIWYNSVINLMHRNCKVHNWPI